MFDAFATGYAWGSPGGIGFFMACLGIFFWGFSRFIKAAQKD